MLSRETESKRIPLLPNRSIEGNSLRRRAISISLPPLNSLNHYLRAALPAQGHTDTEMEMVCFGNSFEMYAGAFFRDR